MDILTEKHVDMIKASYLALNMMKYLALHLVLMTESHLGLIIEAHLDLMMYLIWVPQISPLMVLMVANPWVHCLVFQLDKMLELSWVLLMVLLVVILMACFRDKHWQYHLDLLVVKHLA